MLTRRRKTAMITVHLLTRCQVSLTPPSRSNSKKKRSKTISMNKFKISIRKKLFSSLSLDTAVHSTSRNTRMLTTLLRCLEVSLWSKIGWSSLRPRNLWPKDTKDKRTYTIESKWEKLWFRIQKIYQKLGQQIQNLSRHQLITWVSNSIHITFRCRAWDHALDLFSLRMERSRARLWHFTPQISSRMPKTLPLSKHSCSIICLFIRRLNCQIWFQHSFQIWNSLNRLSMIHLTFRQQRCHQSVTRSDHPTFSTYCIKLLDNKLSNWKGALHNNQIKIHTKASSKDRMAVKE